MAHDLLFPPSGPTSEFLAIPQFFPEDQQAVSRLELAIIPWLPQTNEQQPQKPRKINAQTALKSAEGFLRRSASAGSSGSGDSTGARTEIERQIGYLVQWAKINRRLISPALAQRSDVAIGGVEHDVFHDEVTGRWLKITKPNKCGMATMVHGEEVMGVPSALSLQDALPAVYLERLRLANTNFGDNLCLHGVIIAGDGPRVVISQSHVLGESASPGQIAEYFKAAGFAAVKEKTFYNDKENLLISDAHSGNMLRNSAGFVVAIDMIVQRPQGTLRSAVEPKKKLSFDDDDESNRDLIQV